MQGVKVERGSCGRHCWQLRPCGCWGRTRGLLQTPSGARLGIHQVVRQAQPLAQGNTLDRQCSLPLLVLPFLLLRHRPGLWEQSGHQGVGHVPFCCSCTCISNGGKQRRLLVLDPSRGLSLPQRPSSGRRSSWAHAATASMTHSVDTSSACAQLASRGLDVGDGILPRGRRVGGFALRLVALVRQGDVVVLCSLRRWHRQG